MILDLILQSVINVRPVRIVLLYQKAWTGFLISQSYRQGRKSGIPYRRNAISYTTLKLARDGHLCTVTLYRPAAGNRIDALMAAELRGLAAELSADDSLRVVLLTGSGAAFSVGRDMPPDADGIGRMQAARAIASLPVPVVVASERRRHRARAGAGAGGGLSGCCAAREVRFFLAVGRRASLSTAPRNGCPGWWGRYGRGICC